MKVALCLSGQARRLNKTFDSLKKYVIDPFGCDVFLHTWNFTHYYKEAAVSNKLWYGQEHPDWEHFDGEYALKYLNLLRPCRFIVEPPHEFMDIGYYISKCTPENSRMQAKSFFNVLSMFYSIFMSHRCMLEWCNFKSIKYDYVIRARTDLSFYDTPTIPQNGVGVINYDGFGGLPDHFAMGDLSSMNFYSACYTNIRHLFDEGCNFHPETFLKKHLDSHGVSYNYIPTCYEIVR